MEGFATPSNTLITKNIDSNQILTLMDDFVVSLRKHPFFKRSYFIFCPERITGNESGHLYERIRNYKYSSLISITSQDKSYQSDKKTKRKIQVGGLPMKINVLGFTD